MENKIELIKEGYADPLPYYRQLVMEKQRIEMLIEECKPFVFNELEKLTKEEMTERGWTINQGRTIWNFKGCPEWVELNKKLKDLETDLKARTKVSGEVFDPETGEVLPKPTWTVSARSITVKLPKDGEK